MGSGNPSWCFAPALISFEKDEVHVWRASLDVEMSRLKILRSTLSADEQAKAGRFYFQTDRDRFIVARGLLRTILGRYLGLKPSQLQFSYSPYGKPALASEFSVAGLRFNLSYSDELALYAITHGREIGIDIERIRPELAQEGIAERFFSPREVVALRNLPADVQPEAFFTCWTRKEAYAKARGPGLELPLDQFDVSLTPGQPASLLCEPGEPFHWSIRELFARPGYVAAIAVEGNEWQLRCWQWPE
jgi:4'-phosphopantetheinyl transferase